MEDQSRPRRDLKSLWLLPILALGLGVFVASWKKPVSHPLPTGSGAFGDAERAKYDAYRYARYALMSQGAQGQPKGFTVAGSAPYTDGMVTQIGPARFRCSSSLTVRSQAGEVRKERWQCIITGNQNNWAYENFQHTRPERVPLSGAQKGASIAGNQ